MFSPRGVGSIALAVRVAILSLLLLAAAGELPVYAGESPADPVPEDRWGTLRPHSILGDSTFYDGGFIPRASTPIWHGVDIAGDYLFSATGKGVMVHKISTDPRNPEQISYTYGPDVVPTWLESDVKFYLYSIEVPPSNTDVGATIGAGNGTVIWNFSNKTSPTVHYQDYDHGSLGNSLWSTTINDRHYLFTGSLSQGVNIYDMSAAQSEAGCVEATGSCGDVYIGNIDTLRAAEWVDGTGTFLSVAVGYDGVEVYAVGDPKNPLEVFAGDPGGRILSTALWRQSGKYYLALLDVVAQSDEYYTTLYDVSCIASATCSNANPLATPLARLPSDGFFMNKLTVSQSDGRTYLYVGSSDRNTLADQREFLWDVTTPSAPTEITPDNPPGMGYWGWYYKYQFLMPREALVENGYIYRAAYTVFDVHELQGASPPVAAFDWSPQANDAGDVYQGQQIAFTDMSSGSPTGWFWTFSGASPSDVQSTLQNPSVTFESTGTATVTLSATNEAGTGDPTQRSFEVLDPKPSVSGVSFSPSDPLVCQRVSFAAEGVEGRPQLSYDWEILDGSGTVVDSGDGSSTYEWQTGAATQAGDYTGRVTVSNAAGSATASSAPLTLQTPPSLAVLSGPSHDPFDFGTVQFRAETQGASTWTWDFGDGTVETFHDQQAGENPTHTYTEEGSYTATLTVDNCIATAESATVSVTIDQIQPIEPKFRVDCDDPDVSCPTLGGGFLTVAEDRGITFDDLTTGADESTTWSYDWDGDGTFEDGPHNSPVTEHTYANPDNRVSPQLKVVRGSEPAKTYTHEPFSVVAAQPASISVAGPSTGSVGDILSFSASASNCTPSPSGWTWSATDGDVTPDGDSATVRWSTTGTKSVRASNSACGAAVGSTSVLLTSGTDGGGGGTDPPTSDLDARFDFTPSTPEAGVQVRFDASASLGDPTGYSWTFGDGGSGSGEVLTHTFDRAGSYEVTLSVSAPGDECTNQVGFNVCTDDETATVVVAESNRVVAAFSDDDACGGGQVGGSLCVVGTGQELTFTDASSGDVAQRSWSFGDGTSATGKTVRYAWPRPGNYTVTLTVANDETSDSVSKTYTVQGSAKSSPVVLPWIAQADPDKILQQESDLYVHNPGPGSLTVEITFRKQGLPEPDPPSVKRTLAEHATLYFADVMTELFNRPNIKGFLEIEPLEGEAQPVVTSFNRTFNEGRTYGQVIPGFPRGESAAERQGGADVLHLVGLNDNSRRLAYFGITNPTDERLRYNLRFYDALGRTLASTPEPLAVPRFGFRQFQVENIHDQFGVRSQDDYRVAIEPVESVGPPIPFGANLRLGSRDPSFLRVGRTDTEEVFIVGALDTQGLNGSVFQSDLILSNTSGEMINVDVTFTGAGFFTEPTEAIGEPLPPGSTTRMVDVISEWDEVGGVGVLRLESDGPSGIHPLVQGESYEVSNPDEIYGQFMPALTMDDAAVPGKPASLVGLRQDADFLAGTRSTVWLYNPGDEPVSYRLRYFDHGGRELSGDELMRLPAGRFRQINPGHHPLPEGGAPEGFVLRVEVQSGALLVAGQVVNDFNDPAYLVGR